jgi:hypothetical protein
LYVNSIEKYLGSPIDFEDWELDGLWVVGECRDRPAASLHCESKILVFGFSIHTLWGPF